MKRRTLVIAGMWIAAALAMVGIYLALEPPPDRTRTVEVGGVRVYEAGRDRAPARSRTKLRVGRDEGSTARHRGGPRQTGRSPYRGPENVRRAWRYEAGGRIAAQAIVGSDGTIYVGDLTRNIHAIAPDGDGRWVAHAYGPVWSAGALIDDTFVIGSDADVVLGLSTETGETRWRIRTGGDSDSAIAVAPDGTLRFTGGSDLFSATADGTVRWRFRARGPFVISTPAIDTDGTAYLGSSDDRFYAVAADGRMRWEFRAQGDIASTAVIGDDGTIYFGSDDQHVYALTRDGGTRWRVHLDGYVRAPLALGRDGDVIVGVYGPRARVVSLDAETGEERWVFPVGTEESPELGIASGPLVDVDGNIYFGAQDDFVYSTTRAGRLRWFHRTGRDIDSAPVLTPNGVLLIGCDDGFLYALENAPEAPDAGIQDAGIVDAGAR